MLEPLRTRGAGPSVARVRLLDGPGANEQAVLRDGRRDMRHGEVGDIALHREGGAPRRYDAYRGVATHTPPSRPARCSARAPGAVGSPGCWTGYAAAVNQAQRGLAPPEAALLRGMVLGEDERLTEDVRDEFQRSGLAHILAVSGAT